MKKGRIIGEIFNQNPRYDKKMQGSVTVLDPLPNPRPEFKKEPPMENKTIYIDIKFSTMVVLIIKFFFAMIAACIVMFFFGAILAAAIPALGDFFNAIYAGWILGQLS